VSSYFFLGFHMNLCVRLSTVGLFLAFTCLILNGCNQSKPGTIVKGSLVANGAAWNPPIPAQAGMYAQALKPPPGVKAPDHSAQYRPRVNISTATFSSTAIVAADGTFEFRGDDGKGIPPGEYSVTITGAPPPSTDPFGGKLAGKSPFTISVPATAGANMTAAAFDVGPFVGDAPPAGGSGS
jgi:hypothetical protein